MTYHPMPHAVRPRRRRRDQPPTRTESLWLILLLGFLSACRPATPLRLSTISSSPALRSPVPYSTSAPAVLLPSPTASIDAELSPSPEASPTLALTAVLAPGGDPDQSGSSPAAIPTPAPDPLRFVFPSPAPAPVSAWRPPLYPTPWALSPYDHFYFARPTAADQVNWPLWNYRYGGAFFEDVIHTGIDIVVGKGTPVLAAGSGKIVWAGFGLYQGVADPKDPYGLAIMIHHDFGYQGQSLYTVYAHLDRVDVVDGQYVHTGDMLGLSGETGHVTGPHLHFEVRLGSGGFFTTRNPELWLAPPQGWGVLAGRITDSSGQFKTSQDVIVHSLSSGQNWLAKSYGADTVNSDPYYQENIVISDLPAGRYEIRIPYAGYNYSLEIEIKPGVVNYFTFRGHKGFEMSLPRQPGEDFEPPLPKSSPEATHSP